MGDDPFDIRNMDTIKGSRLFSSFCKSLHCHANRFIGFDHPEGMELPIYTLIGDRSGLRTPTGKKQVFTVCPIRVDVDGKDFAEFLSFLLVRLVLWRGMKGAKDHRPCPISPKDTTLPI